MRGKISDISRSYFAYVNHWRPSVSLGRTPFQSSVKTWNKWQIVVFTTFAITLVTLTIAIYNVVISQSVSNNLPTATPTTTTTATTTITTITTTTTTSPTTTAPTTTSSSPTTTVADAATTFVSTEGIPTTSVAVTTDLVTTSPPELCPKLLPYGSEVNDKVRVELTKHRYYNKVWYWNVLVDSALVRGKYVAGTQELWVYHGTHVHFNVLRKNFTWGRVQYYSREDKSEINKAAVACLLNRTDPVTFLYVATWVVTGEHYKPEYPRTAFQFVLATFSNKGTYVIITYLPDIPRPTEPNPFKVWNTDPEQTWFLNTTYEERKGTRQIYNIAAPFPGEEEPPNIEAVEGCEIFTC